MPASTRQIPTVTSLILTLCLALPASTRCSVAGAERFEQYPEADEVQALLDAATAPASHRGHRRHHPHH